MSSSLSLLGGTPVRSKPFPAWPVFGEPEEARLLRALRSGHWGKLSGKEVGEFERRFAAMHGAKHGVAVVNGTVSLRLALMALGIRAEDEVIVPAYTFLATATAVVEANAVPVFADIELDTFNLDPRSMEAAITPRTRAIIVVHFAGQPADMDAITTIARKHRIAVIEDAAHAHGAGYRDQPVGSIGSLGSFSFQSSKNLTCGEGGIITTSDDELAGVCRSLHNCGRTPGGAWYEHHIISGNYRLGEFQGAVLNAQLDRFEEQVAHRERRGLYLAEKLSQIPGLCMQRRITECTRHGYHLFMFRVDAAKFGAGRDAILEALVAEGVPVGAGYKLPLYRQPLFLNKAFGPFLPNASRTLDYARVHCPNCELLCYEQGAWLEQRILLGDQSDMDDIEEAFTKVYANRDALRKWSEKSATPVKMA
ncbi:MAG: DegT/DnrJ/EryC1/StrS family aminotransferase [Opitutaceae bacterium]